MYMCIVYIQAMSNSRSLELHALGRETAPVCFPVPWSPLPVARLTYFCHAAHITTRHRDFWWRAAICSQQHRNHREKAKMGQVTPGGKFDTIYKRHKFDTRPEHNLTGQDPAAHLHASPGVYMELRHIVYVLRMAARPTAPRVHCAQG